MAKTLHITTSELEDAFPLLYKKYKKLFGSKRVNILAEAREEFHFSPQVGDSLSDYFVSERWVIQRDGDLFIFDSNEAEQAGKKPPKFNFTLKEGDAILEMDYSYHGGVSLYVHPSFITPLMSAPVADDLSIPEHEVLALFYCYKSQFRFQYFKTPYTFGGEINVDHYFHYPVKEFWNIAVEFTGSKVYKDMWEIICSTLASKGYLRISSNGASQLTTLGKNRVEEIKEFYQNAKF